MSNEFDAKVLALAAHFSVEPSEVTELGDDTFEVESEPGEYTVYTSDERDSAVENAIESYIDDCILDHLPEQYRNYFDREAFKRDVRMAGDEDGMISPHDGSVDEQQINGEWYFIIRNN